MLAVVSMADGGEIVWRAKEWRKQNPDAWEYMVALAIAEAGLKRRFSVRWLMEEARKLDFVDRAGDPFRINNCFNPVFARMIAKEHPETRDFIEFRRSKVDGLV